MLAETDAVGISTFIVTVVVGAIAALGTFAAVVGQWYTLDRRLKVMEDQQRELLTTCKGAGTDTGLAGKAREHDLRISLHSRELSKIWDKIEPGRGGSQSRRALSDSGD